MTLGLRCGLRGLRLECGFFFRLLIDGGCIAFYGLMTWDGMVLNEAFLLCGFGGFLCLEGLEMRKENMDGMGTRDFISFVESEARNGVAFTNGVLRRIDYMKRGWTGIYTCLADLCFS